MLASRVAVFGAFGRFGAALCAELEKRARLSGGTSPLCFDQITSPGIEDCDVTDPYDIRNALSGRGIGYIVNAAGYTDVDQAQADGDRSPAWFANARLPGILADTAKKIGARLIHVSCSEVFDGTTDAHLPNEPARPLSTYGLTKAVGDAAVQRTQPDSIIVRTSWLYGNVGDGGSGIHPSSDFIRDMVYQALAGKSPAVPGDQYGRLTAASDLGWFIAELIERDAAAGTYNFSGAGMTRNLYHIARWIFGVCQTHHDHEIRERVTGRPVRIPTGEWIVAEALAGRIRAPRPSLNTLDLGGMQGVLGSGKYAGMPAEADARLLYVRECIRQQADRIRRASAS